EWQGFGIRFNNASVGDIHYSVSRAVGVYADTKHLLWMRRHMMNIDHSWESVIENYMDVYYSL
ncbi:MAG: glycogen synthase, partial [Chitinophagaceae bacterium]|nr:glycogen synthase [Chitinophagaceae bacterium]